MKLLGSAIVHPSYVETVMYTAFHHTLFVYFFLSAGGISSGRCIHIHSHDGLWQWLGQLLQQGWWFWSMQCCNHHQYGCLFVCRGWSVPIHGTKQHLHHQNILGCSGKHQLWNMIFSKKAKWRRVQDSGCVNTKWSNVSIFPDSKLFTKVLAKLDQMSCSW